MVSMAGEIWLLGRYSSGKTELALSWVENNHAEILCCDSVTLYRGLDIGSANLRSMNWIGCLILD